MAAMLVTEGKASRKDRWVCTVVALGLLCAAGAAFALAPVLIAPALWLSLVFGGTLVLRDVALSVAARWVRAKPNPPATRLPSFCLIVPCLNELSSLKQSVPTMMSLRYEGKLLLCYVLESASTDGGAAYVHECAQKDPRVVPLDKQTPPGGRGGEAARCCTSMLSTGQKRQGSARTEALERALVLLQAPSQDVSRYQGDHCEPYAATRLLRVPEHLQRSRLPIAEIEVMVLERLPDRRQE